MEWYAVYLQSTGQLLSIGTTIEQSVLDDPALGTLILTERPDLSLFQWDEVQRAFAPRPPWSRTLLSKLEFRRRFTTTEMNKLNELRLDQTTDPAIRGALETLNQNLSDATNIDLNDTDLPAGVTASLQILAMVGVIAPEAIATRFAEIMAPATT